VALNFRTNDSESFDRTLNANIEVRQDRPGKLADMVTEAAQFIESFDYQGDTFTHVNNATATICSITRLLANRVADLEAKLAALEVEA
jgi:hypothetical protein